MKTQSPDTHPEIERIQMEAFRQMPAFEKIRRMRQMNEFAYGLVFAEIRRCHPDASEREWQLKVASRYLPADLIQKALGGNPETNAGTEG